MSYVIQILVDANGQASEHTGRYVWRFNANYRAGLGRVWTTADLADAHRFASFLEAAEYYRQVSTAKPMRDDGRPNCPLTAFTVEIYDPEAR